MTRQRSTAVRVLLHLPLLLFMGNIQQCPFVDPPEASLSCVVRAVSLDRGSCVELENPCADQRWAEHDSFVLVNEPAGISIQTVRDPRSRLVCAGASAGTLIDAPVEFEYVRPPEIGVGALRISVGTEPLVVGASAVPTFIQPGESSQLDATASGGLPPYAFSWSPPAGLSNPNIPDPVASPNVSAQYTVTVTDSSGAQTGASVIVDVGVAVTASAAPHTISPGQSAQLSVQVTGGTPPYSFSWTPADGLSATSIGAPTATPTATTTYTVTVTDFFSAVATAQVTVSVTAATGLSACMTITSFSELAAQADGSCSTGTIVEYRWWAEFFGSGQPPRAVTTDPLSPIFRYESPGPHLLRLEVVDASGATSATTAVHDPS